MTWLLVEDDPDIRNVVAMMMMVWGEKPLTFNDGKAAWAWLDNVVNGTFTGELPELALMDIRMPGYTGDKVAARIRQIPAIKEIPIVLMTAFALSEIEIKDMVDQIGIDYLINKPLPEVDDFRTLLYKVRDQRKARLAASQQAAQPEPASSSPTSAQPASLPPAQSAQVEPAPSQPTTSPK